MARPLLAGLLFVALGSSLLLAQDEAAKSGPAVGTLLPKKGAFNSFTVNGNAKDRQHCVVCQFGQRPTVLIFTHETGKKDAALDELLKALDEAIDKYQEQELRGAIIFLSPHERSSAGDPADVDPETLVKQAKARKALHARMRKRAESLKNVVVGIHPDEGPEAYKLDPKTGTTVLFYERLKVLKNDAYAPDTMKAPDAEAIMKAVTDHFAERLGKKK